MDDMHKYAHLGIIFSLYLNFNIIKKLSFAKHMISLRMLHRKMSHSSQTPSWRGWDIRQAWKYSGKKILSMVIVLFLICPYQFLPQSLYFLCPRHFLCFQSTKWKIMKSRNRKMNLGLRAFNGLHINRTHRMCPFKICQRYASFWEGLAHCLHIYNMKQHWQFKV